MEFDFATSFDEATQKHQDWWLNLTPEQRWKANWEHVKVLASLNPDYLKYEPDNYVLRGLFLLSSANNFLNKSTVAKLANFR